MHPPLDPFHEPDPFQELGRPPRPLAAAAAGAGALLGRLPALYRESPGAFLPLAQAANDVAAAVAREIRERALEIEEEAPALPSSPSRETGSAGSLLASLAGEGEPPALWSGVMARPGGRPGWLEIRPEPRSAVLAWAEKTARDPSDAERLARFPLPAGIRLQAILLLGPPPNPFLAGDRFRGEVLETFAAWRPAPTGSRSIA